MIIMSNAEGFISIIASLVFVLIYGMFIMMFQQKKFAIKKKDLHVVNILMFINMALIFWIIAQKYGINQINSNFYFIVLAFLVMYIWKIIEYKRLQKRNEVVFVFNSQFDSNAEKINELLKEYSSKFELPLKYKKKVFQIKFINASEEEINEIKNLLEAKGSFGLHTFKNRLINFIGFSIMLFIIMYSFVTYVL